MLENTQRAIKNKQSRETDNIHWLHNTQNENKQNKNKNTICVGHHYTQRNI